MPKAFKRGDVVEWNSEAGRVCGAFTGASRDKAGLFEVAASGTLFLDEIGDVAPTALNISTVTLSRKMKEYELAGT